jgi:hypothetical protein
MVPVGFAAVPAGIDLFGAFPLAFCGDPPCRR